MKVSTFDPSSGANAVTLTAAALRHFEKALEGKGRKIARLSTETSGCTGYAYVLDLVDGPGADDLVLHLNDKVTLAIAKDALDLVHGTEIDLVTQGVNSVVKFNNPNVVAECGCGESFSVG